MDLTTLGWNYQLRQQFREYEPHGLIPARVAHEEHGVCFVLGPDQRDATDAWMAAPSEPLREAQADADRAAVGDWVAIRPQGSGSRKATIHAVLPARTRIAHRGRVLAANVDVLFLVASLGEEPELRALEGYLALAWDSGASPVVLLAEADRCPDVVARAAAVGDVCPGMAVHPVSVATGQGLDALRAQLRIGWTTAFLSAPGPQAATAQLVASLSPRPPGGDGRCGLYLLPDGGLLIDTAALRGLQLTAGRAGPPGAAPAEDRFDDIEALAERCRFRDCTHRHEPGCAVREAIETGAVKPERLHGYRRLNRHPNIDELSSQQRVRRDEHERGRQVSRWAKRGAPPER